MKKKLCSKCNTEKHLSEFNKKTKSKDGYQSHCRSCQRATNNKLSEEKKCLYSKNRKKVAVESGKLPARKYIQRRIQSGTIKKPELCCICKAKPAYESHHEDYKQPDKVIWCCTGCHRDIHNERLSNDRLKNYKQECDKLFNTGE